MREILLPVSAGPSTRRPGVMITADKVQRPDLIDSGEHCHYRCLDLSHLPKAPIPMRQATPRKGFSSLFSRSWHQSKKPTQGVHTNLVGSAIPFRNCQFHSLHYSRAHDLTILVLVRASEIEMPATFNAAIVASLTTTFCSILCLACIFSVPWTPANGRRYLWFLCPWTFGYAPSLQS